MLSATFDTTEYGILWGYIVRNGLWLGSTRFVIYFGNYIKGVLPPVLFNWHETFGRI